MRAAVRDDLIGTAVDRQPQVVRIMIRRMMTALSVVLAGAATHAQEPMGVTFMPGSADVRVWAPNASSVSLVGTFNGWRASRGDELIKDPVSGVWSGTLRGSRARGAYAFLIDGVTKRDPYGRAVSPDEKHSVFYDPSAFDWGGVSPPAVALDEMVIYEMHIGAFHDPRPQDGITATFDDAVRRLDYLVELGVNTLCVMPVSEFAGRHSWGYNPSDPFAVEQAYGGPDGLKRFVRECHRRGLAVHLDIVHNHYGPQNLDLLRFDGTGGASGGGIYFYDDGDRGQTPWGPRPRFSDPMVRRYIRDNIFMWIEEFRVNGFRWDSTVNIRAFNNGADAIPEGQRMLDDINREIMDRHPGVWSIAEDSYGIGNFHGSWDYDFHHEVTPALRAVDDSQRSLYGIRSALLRRKGMERVIYVDSHDEAGLLNRQQRLASDIDAGNPGSDHVTRMSGLGALLTLTAPGIPMILMGNEFQEYGPFHDDRPLDWSKARLHGDLLLLHRDLIALRLNRAGFTPGLKGSGVEAPLFDNDNKVMVYWRWREETPADTVVVAMNLSHQPREVTVPFPVAGNWQMRLDTDWARYGGNNRVEKSAPFRIAPASPELTVTLPGYSARIYSLVTRPAPGTGRTYAAPSRAVKREARPPLSMYASMHVPGNFNGWNRTANPMKLVEDYIWEANIPFDQPEPPSFRLSANEEGVIRWGGYEAELKFREQASIQVKRLGTDFVSAKPWHGVYRFRFNEDQLLLEIEKIDEDPSSAVRAAAVTSPAPTPSPPPAAEKKDIRTWTDIRGVKVRARLLEVPGVMVSLETDTGQKIQLPRSLFSEKDQQYIDAWLKENGE